MDKNPPSNKGIQIADLSIGEHFTGIFLASNVRLVPFHDATRGNYLRLTLRDRTGMMEARIWEDTDRYAEVLRKNQTVKVEAEVEQYRDQLQVRIIRMRLANETEYRIEDLLPTTDRDTLEMMHQIDRSIDDIKDPHLQQLLRIFFSDESFRSDFSTAPAARRIHHAYRGGLLEHVYEILSLSQPLFELYPEIKRELLTTGILLHDIGKLQEYVWDKDIDFTDRGRLLGHVVLSTIMVSEAIAKVQDFPPALALELEHIILSHHGRYEWGSPRRPKTLEAVALHQLENLDSQVNRFKMLLATPKMGDQRWTDYDRFLGRSLYLGRDRELSTEEQGLST